MNARADSRAEAPLRIRAVTLASIIALCALVVGSLIGDRGILRLIAERERAAALAGEIDRLAAENDRLAREILALRGDPRSIERLAREELGLAGADETVFIIRRDPPRTP